MTAAHWWGLPGLGSGRQPRPAHLLSDLGSPVHSGCGHSLHPLPAPDPGSPGLPLTKLLSWRGWFYLIYGQKRGQWWLRLWLSCVDTWVSSSILLNESGVAICSKWKRKLKRRCSLRSSSSAFLMWWQHHREHVSPFRSQIGLRSLQTKITQMLWQVWPNDAVVERGLMIQAEPGERRTQENLVGRENRWDHKAMTKFEGSQSVGGRRASKRSFSEAGLMPVVNHKTYMSFLFWRL